MVRKRLEMARRIIEERGVITASLLARELGLTHSQARYAAKLLEGRCEVFGKSLICFRDEETKRRFLQSLRDAVEETIASLVPLRRCKCCSVRFVEVLAHSRRALELLESAGIPAMPARRPLARRRLDMDEIPPAVALVTAIVLLRAAGMKIEFTPTAKVKICNDASVEKRAQ